MTRFCCVVVTAALIAGCSDSTGVESEEIEVVSNDSGLTIHNGRTDNIYFFASDRATAALILWAPCSDPALCEAIRPGTTRQVQNDSVIGWGKSNEVILWWWHLVPATDNRFRPDSIRAVVVPLR